MNVNADLSDIESSESDLSGGDQAAESCFDNFDAVDVKTDWAEGRQRQISARIQIPCTINQVWQVLTDYDHLADFIPNLAKSRQIPHPHGGIRLEQIGAQSFLKIKFCARVVLDMIEHFPNQLDFEMVEGDFKEFSGYWQLTPTAAADGQAVTELCYVVRVLPPRTMPIALIERRLCHNLSANLAAIRQQVEALFGNGAHVSAEPQ
ncbi:MAG TPA: SRPBCC family protein [Chroococcidiopsis sp.]